MRQNAGRPQGSRRETFLIDAMDLVYARARKFDRPAHAEIILQNPAEFDVTN